MPYFQSVLFFVVSVISVKYIKSVFAQSTKSSVWKKFPQGRTARRTSPSGLTVTIQLMLMSELLLYNINQQLTNQI